MIKQFIKPSYILQELKKKYQCSKISELKNHLKGSKQKSEREAFFGALFAESLNKISTEEFIIRIPKKDDHRDCELLNLTQYTKNQKLSKERRIKYDHFLLQNVQITPEAVKSLIEQGEKNIYEIFTKHLLRTKLAAKSGDYSGCILVFYLNLAINGLIGIKELRSAIRSVTQDKFRQIWIIVPNHEQYQIGELLKSDDLFHIADFSTDNMSGTPNNSGI